MQAQTLLLAVALIFVGGLVFVVVHVWPTDGEGVPDATEADAIMTTVVVPEATSTVPVAGESFAPAVGASPIALEDGGRADVVSVPSGNRAAEPDPVAPVVSSGPSNAEFEYDASWKEATVNLVCSNRYGNVDDIVSGSGTIIDPRGIILTNAHVAVNFIFADWPDPSYYNCTVRTGSPARHTYKASLLYIPDAYVREVIDSLYTADEPAPADGHDDYALLVITGRTNPSASLPESFPYIPAGTDTPPKGSLVYLQGYPAGYLGGLTALNNLNYLATPTNVLGTQRIGGSVGTDVMWFDKSIAAQHGDSGGSVISNGGKVAGLMTFLNADFGYTTNERVLYAITTAYVSADMQKDVGMTLQQFIGRDDPAGLSRAFVEGKVFGYAKEMSDLFRQKQGYVIPGSY